MTNNKDMLISVIVPVYNVEKYLEKCLDSIITQTYEHLEVILVDDGSKDSSGKICDRYAKLDKRIKVIHKDNGGQASARNLALSISSGSFVGFVDSDDWIEPNMYEELINGIGQNDIAVCGRYRVDETTGERSKVFTSDCPIIIDNKEAVRRFLTFDMIDAASWDKLFRRKLLDGVLYPEGYICEDLPFVYNSLKKANGVIQIGKPLYNYLQRSGSTSKSSFSQKTLGMYLYPKEISEDAMKKWPDLAREATKYYRKEFFAYLKMYFDSAFDSGCGFRIKYRDIFCGYYSNKEKLMLLLMKFSIYRCLRKMIKRD